MLSWFKQLFQSSQSDPIDPMNKFLIVGLGNIGAQYANTRHNIGFKVAKALVDKLDSSFETKKLGELATANYKGKKLFVLMPNTYMNRSGKAVRYWLEQEKIPLENLLVITDDLNLDFGTLRIKTKGSDGGHNGLKDIQAQLGTTKYARLRYGISAQFSKGRQVDYVLGKWTDEEKITLPERVDRMCEAVLAFAKAGPANAMNAYNGT